MCVCATYSSCCLQLCAFHASQQCQALFTQLCFVQQHPHPWSPPRVCVPAVSAHQQLAGVYVPEDVTYDDFVRVSKEIMKGRNTTQQREVVAKVLQSLMPEQAPGVFRCERLAGWLLFAFILVCCWRGSCFWSSCWQQRNSRPSLVFTGSW